MTIIQSNVICESKEGSVADETIQCWEKKENPVIMTELNVARLDASGSLTNIDLNCILSETDMKSSDQLTFNWSRCKAQSGEIMIGGTQLVGVSIVKFSKLKYATIFLPNEPVQEFLVTTVGGDCVSKWTLNGSTDITIKGRETMQGCFVSVPGDSGDAFTLTIDFSLDLESCGSGYSVLIDRDEVSIGSRNSMTYPVIQFGKKFKDIVILMSPCDDMVEIRQTYEDASFIEIVSGGGNDTIIIGEQGRPYEDTINAGEML